MIARKLLIVFSLLFAAAVQAQPDVETQLKHELLNRVFTIRNFYANEVLYYDAAGTLNSPAQLAPWTAAGVEVMKVRVGGKRITIEGRRIIEEYDPQARQFVHQPVFCRRVPAGRCNDGVVIHVDFPNGVSADEALAAVHKIFIQSEEDLATLVPDFWHAFFAKGRKREAETLKRTPPGEADADGIYRIGASIQAPKALYHPDPEYTDAARLVKINGTVVLAFVVDTEGVPQQIEIVRPLGAGLDERSIETVRTWRFDPARRKDTGELVSVRLNVEVNFRVY